MSLMRSSNLLLGPPTELSLTQSLLQGMPWSALGVGLERPAGVFELSSYVDVILCSFLREIFGHIDPAR